MFDAYHQEALRLQEAYASKIKVLIGTETEWIRPSSQGLIESLFNKYSFDIFVGSVHHVHTIPIDYDSTMYQRARRLSGGTDEKLFEDYFDAQHQMLQALKPPVVGHFDLIRLKSDNPEASFRQWGTVWHKILRNLDFIVSYGGVLELNSAALRKDMTEPYPKAEICRVSSNRSEKASQGATNASPRSSWLDEAGSRSQMIPMALTTWQQTMTDSCNLW